MTGCTYPIITPQSSVIVYDTPNSISPVTQTLVHNTPATPNSTTIPPTGVTQN